MANYFLDTSAFAKLYHQEAGSEYVEHLVEQKGNLAVVSRLTLVEIESVIAIKVRRGELDSPGQDVFRRRLPADLSQGRIRTGPPIDESHYREARGCWSDMGHQWRCEPWTQFNLLLLYAFGRPA